MEPSIEAPVHVSAMKRFKDCVEDGFGSEQHVIVPEPQDLESRGPQEVIATGVIGLLLDVLASVQLDDYPGVDTGKDPSTA